MSSDEQRPKIDLDAWAQSVIGKTIAEKYSVVSELGRGGMGGVFLATHSMLGDRNFAIKLIIPNPDMGTPEEQEKRFAREAASSLSFVHQRAVQVRDFGFDHTNDVMYMAMDYVEGRSLKDIIEEASATKVDAQPPIETSRALSLTLKILDALKAAHKAGIVHRDLKPGNIMVIGEGPDEDIQIMDFGFAKLIRATEGRDEDDSAFKDADTKKRISSGVFSERLSALGKVVGTPQYMAPEQARGMPVDHRADLYALGVILYEMLSGALPHTASSAHSLLVARASSAALSLTEVRPDIDFPPEVQILTEFALSVDPSDRFQSASRFAASIIEALNALGEAIDSDLKATQDPATGEFPIIRDAGGSAPRSGAKSKGFLLPAVGGAVVAVVAVVALLIGGGGGGGGDAPGDHLARGRAALSLGDYATAIEALEAVIAANPDDAEAAALLRDARVARALAEVRRLADGKDLDALEKAIGEARRVGVDKDDLGDPELVLKIGRGLQQIDVALAERRYTLASDILEDLPGFLMPGLAERISQRKIKIDTQLERAGGLLQALEIKTDDAAPEELATAAKSLTEFLADFPHHPKRSLATSALAMIQKLAVDRAKRVTVSVTTLPDRLVCKLGDTFLGTSPFTTRDVPAGEHTVHVHDDRGFVSAHVIRARAGQPLNALFDHGKAVAAEVAAYKSVQDARSAPLRLSDACKAYLAGFPRGAKRAEVQATLRKVAALASTTSREASAAYVRIRAASPKARGALLTSFLETYGDSAQAPEARALLARLERRQNTFENAMTLLDDYEATPESREEVVRSFVDEFASPEYESDRMNLLRALLVRPVNHDGAATLIAGAGTSRFCVYSADTRTVSLHRLPSGEQTADASLPAPMSAMDGFQDGRIALAEREGGVYIWAPPAAPKRALSLRTPARTLIALANGTVIICSGRPGDVQAMVPGAKPARASRVPGLKGIVLAGCRSTDGALFALGSDKGELVVFDTPPRGPPKIAWRTRLRDAIASVSLSPSKKTLAVGVVDGKRVATRVFDISKSGTKPVVSYAAGHSWMQAVDDAGTIVAAGRVLLPSAPRTPVSIKLGAHPAIDSLGRYLVSAAADGKAVVSYLPELVRQATASIGADQ